MTREGGSEGTDDPGEISTGSDTGKTRDKIGEFAGVSGRTVDKIVEVAEADVHIERGVVLHERDQEGAKAKKHLAA